MQTLQQKFEQCNHTQVVNLIQCWRLRLALDCPEQSVATRESIIRWLIGDDLERFERINHSQMEITQQAMTYRYRLLRQRYLGKSPGQAYRNLITRLGSLVVLRQKIRAWVSLSHDRASTVIDVLQEVISELLQSDRYMQQQMAAIAKCTSNARLKNALLLASVEEYCLRRIRHQPLIILRFVNYMYRTSRGGVTQVPKDGSLLLIFEEISYEDGERISLVEQQAISQYQDTQVIAEQQALREAVREEFSRYLACKLGAIAVKWFYLYMQGHSQQAIAQILNLPVKEVYRLREKICYHATRVFSQKYQPELVSSCLG